MFSPRFIPLVFAFAVAIPVHSNDDTPIAFGDTNSDDGGGFHTIGRGPASAPADAPTPPPAKRAPASKEKVRPNLPKDLKRIEGQVNVARHLIMNDCRTQMYAIGHSEDAFFHKLKDDPARTGDYSQYLEIYNETTHLNHLLVAESTMLNTLDAWLDSIANNTPNISRSEFEALKNGVSDLDPAFSIQEEFFSEKVKDPKDIQGNRKFKEDFARMDKLVSEFSEQEPDKASEWVKNGENINAQSHLKFLALMRKAGERTTQASRALTDYVEQAGWVSAGK